MSEFLVWVLLGVALFLCVVVVFYAYIIFENKKYDAWLEEDSKRYDKGELK